MTQQEKQHLQKLIEKLPARNLNRIVEIIHHGKSSDIVSFDEIFVNLEEQVILVHCVLILCMSWTGFQWNNNMLCL